MLEREIRDLAFVPRWTIARTIKTQSVAEHAFYVTYYARWLAKWLDWDSSDTAQLLTFALYHDAEESFTGDIPGPAKRSMTDDKYNEWTTAELKRRFGMVWPGFPSLTHLPDRFRLVLKVANLLDEVMFLNGERQMGNHAIGHMFDNSLDRLSTAWFALPYELAKLNPMWVKVVDSISQELTQNSVAVINNEDLAITQP